MDKQMIEEMANIIHRTEFVDISGYEEEKIAEELLKHYQPKIPENAVVLTMEEWECLHNDYAKALYNARQNERKETAEKFAERLKERLEMNLCLYGSRIVFDGDIDEICKEITEGKV